MRTVFLTGAGISTAAGIPDFRGPQGLWSRDPKAARMSTLDHHLGDQQVRKLSWKNRAATRAWRSEPTPVHRAIAHAQELGTVSRVITQNTDGLHQKAGSPRGSVFELHGNVLRCRCEGCGNTWPMADIIARVDSGEADPGCSSCGGILRATTILFGEMLDDGIISESVSAAQICERIVAVGTSLTVTPASSLFAIAVDAGAHGIIVNAEPTPYDQIAHDLIRDDIQAAVPALIASWQ